MYDGCLCFVAKTSNRICFPRKQKERMRKRCYCTHKTIPIRIIPQNDMNCRTGRKTVTIEALSFSYEYHFRIYIHRLKSYYLVLSAAKLFALYSTLIKWNSKLSLTVKRSTFARCCKWFEGRITKICYCLHFPHRLKARTATLLYSSQKRYERERKKCTK